MKGTKGKFKVHVRMNESKELEVVVGYYDLVEDVEVNVTQFVSNKDKKAFRKHLNQDPDVPYMVAEVLLDKDDMIKILDDFNARISQKVKELDADRKQWQAESIKCMKACEELECQKQRLVENMKPKLKE